MEVIEERGQFLVADKEVAMNEIGVAEDDAIAGIGELKTAQSIPNYSL